jgi:uncharacterized protein YwgA
MLSRAGKLNLLLKELNWLSISTFGNRKILQKTVYILHEMGLKSSYSYNWYLHGPYSPDLAEDAYEIESNKSYYDQAVSDYKFKDNAKIIIQNFKDVFQGKENNDVWLELICSLLFLKRYYKQDDAKLRSMLLSRKPQFKNNPSIVDKAISFINENFDRQRSDAY